MGAALDSMFVSTGAFMIDYKAVVSRLATVAAVAVLSACGDDDPIPIDQIPDSTPLTGLSGPEMDGVCDWGAALARQKLPPGTMCDGVPIMFTGCMTAPPGCTATVGQWKACIPNLLDRFAQDPCQLLDLAFSPQDLGPFIEATPSCMGLGPCGSAMSM